MRDFRSNCGTFDDEIRPQPGAPCHPRQERAAPELQPHGMATSLDSTPLPSFLEFHQHVPVFGLEHEHLAIERKSASRLQRREVLRFDFGFALA